MEKMFIEALAELKGGKKKLRELLDTVHDDYEQARQMRDIWTEKAAKAHEAIELIEQKLGREEPKDPNESAGGDFARAAGVP